MVGYSLGSMHAIPFFFFNRILESIHSSNLCECFYLPDVLGSINLPERFVKCVVIPAAPGLSKFPAAQRFLLTFSRAILIKQSLTGLGKFPNNITLFP